MKKLTLPEGAALIQELAKRNAPHAAHDGNAKECRFWTAIVTGKKQDEIIISYKLRESEEQKEQRVRLLNTPTPEAAFGAVSNYERLESAEGAKPNLKYTTEKGGNMALLLDRLIKFNGNRDLRRYLHDEFKKYIQIDPNAFLVVLFDGARDDRGMLKEKPFPRPEIVPCTEVYDFGRDNGEYLWLCRRQVFTKKVKENDRNKEVEWQKYTLYFQDYVLELQEINEANPETAIKGAFEAVQIIQEGEKTERKFALLTFLTNSGEVPFMPFGYNQQVDGGGYDSLLKPAESRFRDLVNRASEYALHIALHAFLQKYQYVGKCTAQNSSQGRCDGGKMSVSGTTCATCKGTGKAIVATVQDVVTITLPETRDEFFPLSEMVKYVDIPFETIEHLKAEVDALPGKIEAAIWGIDLREKPDGQLTATEVLSRYDTVYVRLSRIGKHWADMWAKCVRLTARYAEIDAGLMADYSIPTNYQMESFGELLTALKSAKDAGAPYEVVRGLELSVISKQGKATPEQIGWNEALEVFRPWRTKTSDQIAGIVAGLADDEYYKVLWMYFDEIFEEIKQEQPGFVKFEFAAKKKIVTVKVAEFQARIKEATPEPAQMSAGIFDRTPVDTLN